MDYILCILISLHRLHLFLFFFHFFFFFFNDTATTEIYTLSLHDALPIFEHCFARFAFPDAFVAPQQLKDRKSTRLNSSHGYISYAVFCLKKKTTTKKDSTTQNKTRAKTSTRHPIQPS